MASQLKVDTLTGVTTAGSIVVTGEGNSTTTNLQQGLAKHWVNYDAVNQTTDGSFNQSSLTDSDVGLFISTYTNALSGAADKCILGMSWDTENDGSSQRTANARGGINIQQDGNVVNATSSIKVKVYQGSTGSADGGEVDQSANYWSTFGDLA
tara:strand:+ start:411 stop:869 length:459 start_codon:yes stop_codon:yes gene_type:complete